MELRERKIVAVSCDVSRSRRASKVCGDGTKTRTRTVVGLLGEVDVADREAQCPTAETIKCNLASCPKTDQCHFLKCRYAENPATGKFGIQVYYGNALRPGLLEAAGIAVLFIDFINLRQHI